MKFSELKINERIVKALDEIGFTETTDIQEKVIPLALDGKDLIGLSRTGSGKTAAFGVPIAELIDSHKGIQAVIIGPTRELVNQVSEEMKKFCKNMDHNVATIYGGVSMEPQYRALKKADIVVGTPGRMLDHMQRGSMKLNNVKILVLDEADRMLDMGFVNDIKKIISATPKNRQSLLFSATMPDEIKNIVKRVMKNPVTISGERYVASHLLKHYYFDVKQEEKLSLLEYTIKKEKPSLAIVFCATRQVTDFVYKELAKNDIEAKAIHGGMTQAARTKVLEGFHRGKPHILVATDVAARGLDIKDVSHIFNYDIPRTVEDYTHRIGRTAREGKKGETISLLSREDHEPFRKIIRKVDIEKKEKPDDFDPRKIFFKRPQGRGGFGRGPPRNSNRRGPPRNSGKRFPSRRH